MNKARHGPKWCAGLVLGFVLVNAPACKDKPGDSESTSSTSSSGTTSSGTSGSGTSSGTTAETQGMQTSAGSTQTASEGTMGLGVCDGPEHEAFQKALCPAPYPSCTPDSAMLPPTYCQDAGFGPVGSGECACTPTPTHCGVDGSDEILSLCCCRLEDLEVDP